MVQVGHELPFLTLRNQALLGVLNRAGPKDNKKKKVPKLDLASRKATTFELNFRFFFHGISYILA
jgi:hypothetical protein